MTANYHNHNRQWRRFPALCWPGSVAILSFLLLPVGAAAAPPTVSNIGFEAGSHSSVAITFAVSAAINASRIRYIPVAQGSCTSGTGGQVQNNSMGSGTNILSYIRLDVTGLLPNTQYQFCPEVSSDGGGTWSSGVGATWTTLPLSAIHPALPIHPATFDTSYPDETHGTCWSTGQPGYCKVTEPVSGNICPNLSSDIANAVKNQMTGGTEIDIPAGSVCSGRIWWEQMAPDTIAYDPSKVSNNTITLANHGLAEGQGVVFDNTLQGGDIYNAAMPGGLQVGYVYFVHVVDANNIQLFYPWTQTTGSTVSGSTTITVASTTGPGGSTGIAAGQEVLGAGIAANTTVTAISGNSLTLSQAASATASGVTLTFGGGLVSITPGGTPSSSNYDTYFVKWPRPIPYWIVVRTSTPDSQFAPAGTRVNPAWAPKMAVLQMPAQTTYQPTISDVLLTPFYGYDSYGSTFATKIRFTGVEFTWTAYTGPASDPVGHSALVLTHLSDSNFVFDRDWFHNPGTRQDRVIQAFNLQGMNMAIKDSYWDGMDYWRPTYYPNTAHSSTDQGAPPPTQISSTSYSIAPVSVWYGAPNPGVLSSKLTVSWTGTPDASISNPQIATYFDMNDNLITAVPTGITATVSQGSVLTVTTGTNGNLSCNGGTGWPGQDPVLPVDANGRAAAAPVGCANLNADGTIKQLSVNNGNGYDAWIPSEITEGCQCFVGGVGPGPYQISNNYISGTGLVMHFDDSGGGRIRGDYLVRRNTWHVPFEHMSTVNNPTAQAAGIPSDGYEYANRQPLEWKGGQRAWIDGNVFDGTYRDVTPNGVFFDVTPRTNGSSTDFDVTDNTFQHGPVGTSPITPIDGCCSNYLSWPGARYRLSNNLFWDINGWVYSVYSGGGSGYGAIFPGTGGPDEDLIVDHNTFYDFQGQVPQWMNWSGYPLEGFQMTNNIVSFAYGGGFATPGWSNSVDCGFMSNETFMNCAFSAGNSPDYIFKDNVIVPGWAMNGYPPLGQLSQATVQGDFPDYQSQNYFLPNISGVPAAYASVQFFDSSFTAGNFSSHPDFRLQSTSAYQSGGADHASDGKVGGVDIDSLEAAQGKVMRIGVPSSSIASTSAMIAFVAPDAQGCPVDYSSTDPTLVASFTRAADAGGGRVRNISLTGLSGRTTYYYRVNCAVQQPMGSFRTN